MDGNRYIPVFTGDTITAIVELGFGASFNRMLILDVLGCVCMCVRRMRDDVEGCAYDQQSSSIIRLNNGTILYLREVNRSDNFPFVY